MDGVKSLNEIISKVDINSIMDSVLSMKDNGLLIAESDTNNGDTVYFLPELDKPFELIIEGGYKKVLLDIGKSRIDEIVDIWMGELIDTYPDATDDELNKILEAYAKYIFGEDTYRDLRRDAPNYLRIRDKSKQTPGSKYHKIDKDNIMYFTTPSHTIPGVVYTQRVKLLDLDKLIEKYKGEKKPLDIVRMALEGNIQVHCTDPSWKYWGFQYIGTTRDYALEKEPRYPKVRNPNLQGSVCKHLDNVLYILPFQNTKVLRDLRKMGRL